MNNNINQPLVSVIVPCYNQATYLAETLDSVLAQTYTNWECVIVDDGSIDNPQKIAELYIHKDPRFKFLRQKNQGPSVARNNGIHASKGQFILPLDSDDIIASTYIEKAVGVFAQDKTIKLVYCKAKFFDKKDEEWCIPDYKYEDILWNNLIFCSALFYRRDYDDTQGYNPNMRGGLEDWDFWLSLLKSGDKVYRIDEILFFYRIKDISRSTLITDSIDKELLRQIFNNHKEVYRQCVQDIIMYRRQALLVEHEIRMAQNQIRLSKAYRLGKFLLAPFNWIKQHL